MIKRNIYDLSKEILLKYNKTLMISGPRQSGKTTFAKMLLKTLFTQGSYVNWDIINDQKKIIKDPYFFEKENRNPKKPFLVILDEIHKYGKWKNYVKGAYDGYSKDFKFIITGSGRLDLFKKGGDSMFGRYLPANIFPLSIGEIEGSKIDWSIFVETLKNGFESGRARSSYEQLFYFTGFPEPFLKSDTRFYNLWSAERKKALIREDIRNAYAVREVSNMEILSNLLPERVSSPLSINSLREDLNVAFDSIKNWLMILEQFYYFFSIRPYSKHLSRAIKKETKIYLYDWSEIKDESKRFENIIAFHLYKAVNLWNASGFGNFSLTYIRDKEGREVDFLVLKDGDPFFLVEAKFSDANISKNLLYFQEKIKAPFAIQIVNSKNIMKKMSGQGTIQYVISADDFLKVLP